MIDAEQSAASAVVAATAQGEAKTVKPDQVGAVVREPSSDGALAALPAATPPPLPPHVGAGTRSAKRKAG
eukprot:3500983-Alexandrium_andersonii.AAC.1